MRINTGNEYIDHTMPRILAFLAAVHEMEGASFSGDVEKEFNRGQALIRRMAFTAVGTDLPCLPLTIGDCADVVAFLDFVDPIEPSKFFQDPKFGPSHYVGYKLVLINLKRELRNHAVPLRPARAQARKGASTERSSLRR